MIDAVHGSIDEGRSLQSTAELESFYRFVNRDAFEPAIFWSRIGSGLPRERLEREPSSSCTTLRPRTSPVALRAPAWA